MKQAFYLIWTSLIYGIGYGNYACYPPQILKEYGPDNTSTIYGFMFTSSVSMQWIINTQFLSDPSQPPTPDHNCHTEHIDRLPAASAS